MCRCSGQVSPSSAETLIVIVCRPEVVAGFERTGSNLNSSAVLDSTPKARTLSSYCVVLDGATVANIMQSPAACQRLLDVIAHEQCEACIFCRVNPKQKGDIVKLVKDNLHGKGSVLAVGDGANDINMINLADVGVGIFGLEGMQAASAADYAVPMFKDLHRLLFTHGRCATLH